MSTYPIVIPICDSIRSYPLVFHFKQNLYNKTGISPKHLKCSDFNSTFIRHYLVFRIFENETSTIFLEF